MWLLLEANLALAAKRPDPPEPLNLPTLADLETEKSGAAADNTLDSALKTQILEFYDQAFAARQVVSNLQTQIEQLKATLKIAPQRIQELQNKNAHIVQNNLPHEPEKLASEQLEALFKQVELDWQRDKEQLRQKEEALNQWLTSSQPLSEKIAANNQTIQQLNQEISHTDTNKTLQKARAQALNLRKAQRLTELELWQLQLSQQDLLTNLAQAEYNQLADQGNQRQQQVETLRHLTQQRREQNAQEARKKAEQLQQQTSQLQEQLLRQFNLTAATLYRTELEAVLQQEKTITQQLVNTRAQLDTLKADFERLQQRVERLGATTGIHKLLRKYQYTLPSKASFHHKTQERGKALDNATDRQLELDDSQRALIDPQSLQTQATAQLRALPIAIDLTAVLATLTQHLQAQREALNELQKVYGRYIAQLSALDLAEQERITVAIAFRQYVDNQLLWMPNADWHDLLAIHSLIAGFNWLFAPENLQQGLTAGQQIAEEYPLQVVIPLLFGLALPFFRRALSQRLQQIGVLTRKIRTDSFMLTLQAIALTALLAAPWPLLLMYGGHLLGQQPNLSAYTQGLADSLTYVGFIVLMLNLTRQICRDGGLGEYHLRWPAQARRHLGQELNWLLLAILPLGFIATISNAHEIPASTQLAGRYAFLLIILLCIIFIYRWLRQTAPLMQEMQKNHSNHWLTRLHFLWFPLLIVMGLALLGADITGYHYTIWKLQQPLQLMLWFLLGIWISRDVLLRWLYTTERRLRLEEVLRRREELRAQQAANKAATPADPSPSATPCPPSEETQEIQEINYSELSEQARRLLQISFSLGILMGLWWIWRDWLPSLNLFLKTPLPLETTQVIDGINKIVPLTLADLLLAILILLITILAAKDLPGLLEISLLQHLPLEPGVRYAITTLSQYAIGAVGIIIAFNYAGIEWSSIQWLVAALSVGLGFGLQEIVANFISGIIVLFERPIRVGDIVTIGDTSGVVTKINIRATTILNWDKRELLVPNKEFITGRVLNWTLSNQLNRIVVTIGVSYDTDIDTALKILAEIPQEDNRILKDPPPLVSFESFGENALLLQMRCYLPSLENRLTILTDLNKQVLHRFQQAEIDMAYPQRDIHLTTKAPLAIQIV